MLILLPRFQRKYFYIQVNRGGRNPALESPEPEEEEDGNGRVTKGRSWWESEQEKRILEGKRPPLDKK